MIQTAYWYLHTDQFRYDAFGADTLAVGHGRRAARRPDDRRRHRRSPRGWAGCRPTRRSTATRWTSPTRPARRAAPSASTWSQELKAGRLRFASEDPDSPENFPRVLSIWRANLLGSSAKGNEYFLKHLLGTDSSVRATETPEGLRPRDVVWHDEAPTGKLDLLLTLDFRMTSTTIFSDVVLPAATWYEKHDLNTTDMHPFVHSFNPAISPPWQTRTDWDAFLTIAQRFSELAATHLGVRKDVVAAPLTHDTPDALATPARRRRATGSAGECEPVPGVTMPKLVVVERDYAAVAAKMTALGPLMDTLGRDHQGGDLPARRGGRLPAPQERRRARRRRRRPPLAGPRRRRVRGDPGALGHHQRPPRHPGLPARWRRAPASGWPTWRPSTRASGSRFADTQGSPVPVITSPEWSGSEAGGRRYSPFTINVERLKPWHTLTGRMHFYLDHDWMTELGEGLPVYRPPLDMQALFGEPAIGETGALGVTVRYLTPHSKWSIHSEYQDNLLHALAVARRPDDLDEQGGRRQGRHRRQRLGRGGQPQRRGRRPGHRQPPDARGHGLHAPRPGPADRRPARRDVRASAAASTTR